MKRSRSLLVAAACLLALRVTEATGAPVIVDGTTVLEVRAPLFTFSEEDRARVIAERIAWLSKQPLQRIRTIGVAETASVSEIVSDDLVVMTVTDADAAAGGRSRQELAGAHAAAIRAATERLRHARSARSIFFGVLQALLATIGVGLLLVALRVGAGRLNEWLRAADGIQIRSIRIHKRLLMPAGRITSVARTTARGARAAIAVAAVYTYATFTLGLFPWTRDYAADLRAQLLAPLRTTADAAIAHLPNAFFIAFVLALTWAAVKGARLVFREVGKGTIRVGGFYRDWAEPTYSIVRVMILALAAVVVFHYLPGSDSPAFEGVSLFLGLLLSLGSSAAVAHVVAGSVLTYTRAFQVGDRVRIGEAEGDVTGKTLLVTRIRTIKNVDISIPNASVLRSQIVNFSSSAQAPGLILHTPVTIGYDVAWRTVHRLLIDAALATPHVLPEPRPFVLQTALDDFYVRYEVNAYTDRPLVAAQTYSDLHQHIQDALHAGGVEILSPHYNALRNGSAVAVPPDMAHALSGER